MTSARELLPAYVIGDVDDDERRVVEQALASDPGLADELAALEDAAAALCEALPPVMPDPSVRARLLSSTEGAFARFAARFAELFDVGVERAHDLLAMATSPSAWEPGPAPGTWLLHFTPGPAYATADTGFVKLAPGVTFPWHLHRGEETSLVIAGEALDSLAGRVRPGDVCVADASTTHDFRAVGDEAFVFAVRVFGVDFDVPRPPERAPT